VLDAFAMERRGRRRLLVANFGDAPAEVAVEGFAGPVRVRTLDERSVVDAMMAPEAFRAAPTAFRRARGGSLGLRLLPFAVACVDAVMSGETAP
jgi:hypothetical protein